MLLDARFRGHDSHRFLVAEQAERRVPSDSWSRRHEGAVADTIFALSTPPGRSAVAVIRLSGPRAGEALAAVTGKRSAPRQASLVTFRDPLTGATLDRGLALFFEGPASFTGEDCAELHLHGSMAAVRATLVVLANQPGMREAKPGEFTRRALDNGKLDLSQAEALADLIDAQTEKQRRLALASADAGPARFVGEWRETILDMLASIDAELDFSDEGDVSALARAKLASDIRALSDEVVRVIEAAERTRRVREGFVVAICGPPNSGKSTLLNALVGREQAIVSPYAGTTRDPIEVALDFDGQLLTLIDTAGIRDDAEPIERIGIERSRLAASRADFTVWVEAPDSRAEPDDGLSVDLRLSAKADVREVPSGSLAVSAATGLNMDRLIDRLRTEATSATDETGDAMALRARHVAVLGDIGRELGPAISQVEADALEIAGAHLRGALDMLTSLGAPAMEDAILDRIFGRFCIGK